MPLAPCPQVQHGLAPLFPLGLGEKRSLSVGLDALSVFNHVNMYLPGNSNFTEFNAYSATAGFTTQANFGQLSQANSQGDNRIIQLNIKLLF